ncbi:hypothetical protein CMI37_30060 [Candidatus Pacearchaeota archaeon]|nr:hypothetical protein [Candidatus Pacearchaeota archaeon]|tara:strand:- start:9561 stop:10538 length:978 start_codon:yes stop_codon:yes gene_type:complete
MSYVRTKIIKGRPYRYLQESYRSGGKVMTRHLGYLGAGTVGGGSVGGGGKKLGTTTQTQRVVYGATHDDRSYKVIAKDMESDAKKTYKDSDKWEKKGRGKSDLQGWDTTHSKQYREGYINLQKPIASKLGTTFKGAKVESRVKSLPSIVKKLKKKNVEGTYTTKDFQDAMGARVTFKTLPELKKAVGKIKKDFKVIEVEDYITSPKGGYRSYHFVIEEKGKPIELQFRTPGQTKWADWMHDTLYDNPKNTAKRLGKEGFESAENYAQDVSEYYRRTEEGEKLKIPEVPSIIRKQVLSVEEHGENVAKQMERINQGKKAKPVSVFK